MSVLRTRKANVMSPIGKPVFEKRKPSVTNLSDSCDPSFDVSDADIDDAIILGAHLSEGNQEYRKLIFDNLMSSESNYLARIDENESVKAAHRMILVDWMIRISDEMKLLDNTLFLAVSLFDRVSVLYPVKKCHIQLFGSTCLWIASKMEETLTPAISDFVYLCGNTYKESEFTDCERVILNLLNFSITSTTPLFYLDAIFSKRPHEKDAVKSFSRFFCTSCLMSELYGSMKPSVVALSALFLACAAVGEVTTVNDYPVDAAEVVDCAANITTAVSKITEKKAKSVLYEWFTDCLAEYGLSMREVGDALLANVNERNVIRFCSCP